MKKFLRSNNHNEKYWNQMFDQLVIFKAHTGHCRVPKNYENKNLAGWVCRQRFKKDKLCSTNRHKLEEINFCWNAYEDHWEEYFTKLTQYQKQFGHCNIPENYPPDQNLSRWVITQRSLKKNIEISRRNRLDDIGFEWSWDEINWENFFWALAELKNGHTQINFSKEEMNRWCNRQRKNKSCLSFYKI